MFKIIGADRKEYGPVAAADLRSWIAERRVNAATLAQRAEGGEWLPLASFPEFADLAAPPPPPAPLTAGSPPSGALGESARSIASSLVQGPAIFMIVLGVLDAFGGLAGMAFTLFGASLPIPHSPGGPMGGPFNPNWMIAFQLPSQIAGLLISLICIVGGVRMMQLRNRGFALVCAVLTMLPCGACCCLLNLGCGIWALTVLGKPEVKDAFE